MSAAAPTVGEVLTTTNGTWNNSPTGFTYQWQRIVSGTPANISGATSSSYTCVTADIGNTLRVGVTASNVIGSSSITFSSATGTVSSGVVTGQVYFPAGNASNIQSAFNLAIPASPVIHPSNAAYCAGMFTTATTQWSAVALQSSDGWPVYQTSSSDHVFTINATSGQSVTCHIPNGATPQGPADEHLLIIEPDGITEYEFWHYASSGTYPALTITADNASGPFNVGPSGYLYSNNGTGTAAARTGAVCCLAGLIFQSEFDAGVIPHALAMSGAFTGSGFVPPAKTSDGGHGASAVPMGSRFQLDPAYDISVFTGSLAPLFPIAKALQVYGAFITDSTSINGFQAQRISGTDNPYLALDQPDSTGSASLLSHLPWSSMRFLNSWNGT